MLIPTFNLVLSRFIWAPRQQAALAACGWLLAASLMASHASANTRTQFTIAGAHIIGGALSEGGLILAKTTAGAGVTIDGADVPVTSHGHFVVGFHRDQDKPVTIDITTGNGISQKSVLTPAQRDYDIQRIDGLASTMVTPPAARLKRIQRDSAAVRAARTMMPAIHETASIPDFFTGFDWPVTGRISGVYGGQRILNGQPRQPHYGIDIAAPSGTAVRAPADGTITLVDDLYYSGWTIIMAHGLGVNSSFLHLDHVTVAPGSFVTRGTVIGHVGSSGRSTGPHLDWRIDWQGRRVDAGLIAGPMPSP